MSATERRTVAVASVVVVFAFIAGLLAGVVLDRYLLHKGRGPRMPRGMTTAMIERLDSHLDLTDAQRAKVKEIIERRHERINRMWNSVHPQVRREVEQANAEIEAVLTPAQREKFKKMKMHVRQPRPGRRRH